MKRLKIIIQQLFVFAWQNFQGRHVFGAQPSGGKGIGNSSFPHVFPEKSGCLFQLIGNTPDHITVILILALSHVFAFKCKLMIYACKQYTCIMSALRRIFPLRFDSVTSVAYRKTSIKDKLRNSTVVYMPNPTQIAITPLFTHVSQFNGITNIHSFNGFHSFYDFLRQTFFHNRYVLVTGKDTIKTDTVVYNLSVDKDESYVIPAGIVHNCRCTVERVRRSKYPESDEAQAMLAGSQATAGKHQEMMRFNPGKQMACFPFYNPYTISKCQECPNRSGTLKLAKVPDNELCAACKVIRGMTKERDKIKKQYEAYDEKRWEKHLYDNDTGGYLVTERSRIEAGGRNKQEQAKYDKEHEMCLTFAHAGYRIEHLDETPGISSPDVTINGMPADLKRTKGYGNIVKYARKAVRQQGAEMALFQFDEWNDEFRKQLLILKKEGIKVKYFITGEDEVHSL